MTSSIKSWMGTVSSILGTSGLGAAVTAAMAGTPWQIWAPIAVAGAIAIAMPQNSALAGDVKTLVAAGIKVAGDLDPALVVVPAGTSATVTAGPAAGTNPRSQANA